jgi:hypothetical protein
MLPDDRTLVGEFLEPIETMALPDPTTIGSSKGKIWVGILQDIGIAGCAASPGLVEDLFDGCILFAIDIQCQGFLPRIDIVDRFLDFPVSQYG